jgi:hypothetical protein
MTACLWLQFSLFVLCLADLLLLFAKYQHLSTHRMCTSKLLIFLQTLENRDTPLIQRWSNPLKVRLLNHSQQERSQNPANTAKTLQQSQNLLSFCIMAELLLMLYLQQHAWCTLYVHLLMPASRLAFRLLRVTDLLLLLLLQVRLTSAGMGLAARLYRHAVESGKMQPHAEVGGALASSQLG